MTCIYQRSKYYAKAKLQATSVAQPIGYKFLNPQQKLKPTIKRKINQKAFRYVNDKPLTKQLSARTTPFRDIQKWLKLAESVQRKNISLNGVNLEFVNKELKQQMVESLKQAYFPNWKDYQLCNFIDLLSAMQILRQNVFAIRDYALSSYIAYYSGENLRFYNHIQNAIRQEFIEYSNQILINCPQLSRPQLRKIDYLNKQQVQNYINDIMQIGREKDELFGGIHLYISDILPQKKQNLSLTSQQTQLWGYLQFHVAVVTGVLSEGQHAVIKVGGSFTTKTIQYIFLLRLAFNRTYFHKSNVSNPFSNHKYLICESFNKENGRFISQFILNNYDQILQKKDSISIVDPQPIRQSDFHINIHDFNNLSPIIKTSKEVLKQFQQNSGLSLYPRKETFTKKIQELKLTHYAEQLAKVQQLIPVQQKKQQKKEQIIQKQAVIFDFEALGNLCKPPPKPAKSQYFDLSSQKPPVDNSALNIYLERGDIIRQKVKEQKKKMKQKKEE